MKRKIKRKILKVADLHAGSVFGLLKPGTKTKDGQVIQLTQGQEIMWEHWLKCLKLNRDCDSTALVGDLMQGQHYKAGGEGNCLVSLGDQQRAATEILKDCPGNIFGVSGTGYHTSRDTSPEHQIIKDLKGEYMGYVANVKITGTPYTMNMIHKGSAAMYKGMTAERDIIFGNDAQVNGKLDPTQIFVRAHSHTFRYYRRPNDHWIYCPCFQAIQPDEYTSAAYTRWQPDIGVVAMTIYNNGDIEVQPFLLNRIIHIRDFLRDV
jgi:hypothetical protein